MQKEREIIEALEVELARLQSFDSDCVHKKAEDVMAPLPVWRESLHPPKASWWSNWFGQTKPPRALPDDAIAARQLLLYRELAESQKKCAKLEARKISAIKAKAVYDSAQK